MTAAKSGKHYVDAQYQKFRVPARDIAIRTDEILSILGYADEDEFVKNLRIIF